MTNAFTNKNLSNLKHAKLDWSLVQIELKKKLGLDIYESWLKKIFFVEEFNNYILLSVPTRFIRDWITSRYLDQILQSVKKYKKEIIRIEVKIEAQNLKNEFEEDNLAFPTGKENISFIKDSYLQYNRIDPNKTFESFVIGSSNKLAYEASLKVSENISNYNPLYVYGGVGMGKTHLLNSIGFKLKRDNKVMFFQQKDLCINLLNQLNQMIWSNLKNTLETQMYY